MHLIVNIGVVDFLLFGLLLLGIDFEGQTIRLYWRYLHYVHLVSGLVSVCVRVCVRVCVCVYVCMCVYRERERDRHRQSLPYVHLVSSLVCRV